MQSQKILRKHLRQQRKLINHNERKKFAKKLLHQCRKKLIFKNAKKIAIYLANDGEIDPKYIENFLKNNKFSVYLPVLAGKSLKFAKISKKFIKNKFGIKEPAFAQTLTANKLDIIIMPLVGFNTNKNRMGMGGGFYDRTLNFTKRQKLYRHPKLYGIAFECQKTNEIKAKPCDVQLDGIITPNKIYH